MNFKHEFRPGEGGVTYGGRWVSEDGRYVIWGDSAGWTGAEVHIADWTILFQDARSFEDAKARCDAHANPPDPAHPFGMPWDPNTANARTTEAIRRLEVIMNDLTTLGVIVEHIAIHPTIDDLVATIGMAGPLLSDALDSLGQLHKEDLFGEEAEVAAEIERVARTGE